MEEIKVSEMLQADSIEKDNAVMIIQDGVNKKASGSIQTATGTSLSLTSVADTCKVKSNSKNLLNNQIQTHSASNVTITRNGDGSITLNGTASANVIELIDIVTLKSGKTYTLSAGTEMTTETARMDMREGSKDGTIYDFWYLPNKATETMEIDKTLYVIIRIQSGASFTNKTIYPQLEEGETATSYNPYNTEVLFAKNENEFDKNLVTDNSYFSTATGIISSAPSWMITDYIEIADDKKIRIDGNNSTTTGSGVYGIYYDINKTIVGSIAYVDYKTNKTIITAPHNAKFVKFSFNNGQKDTLIIQSGETLYLTPDETKTVFTYDTETIVEANGSVTIEYNTQSRLLNNDDTTAIKEYVDRTAEEKSQEIYSTEETRMGTWKDGRPLYRKVIDYTIPSGTTSIGISLGVANIYFVQRAEVRFNSVGSGDYVFNSYYSSASDYMRFFMRSNELQIRLGSNTSGFNIVAIVEYTKTTD